MTTAEVATRDPRAYVPDQVWDREVRLIMRDHGMPRELAERTFGQTVAYLITSAQNPCMPMGPTAAVDKGVHSFVLDTPSYWDFCMQNAGTYLHHVPHLHDTGDDGPQLLRHTIQAVRDAGFPLDTELWEARSAKCNQCYAGCTDSPKK